MRRQEGEFLAERDVWISSSRECAVPAADSGGVQEQEWITEVKWITEVAWQERSSNSGNGCFVS